MFWEKQELYNVIEANVFIDAAVVFQTPSQCSCNYCFEPCRRRRILYDSVYSRGLVRGLLIARRTVVVPKVIQQRPFVSGD
jgi:hypothetical protein